MVDLLVDIESYYIGKGYATADGTDIFRDYMPDDPDNCITLAEYPGTPDFISNVSNRSIQVRVRNTNYDTAKAKILNLYNSVYEPENDIRIIDFTTGRWGIVRPREYPYMLKRDESMRFVFVFNMGVVTPRDT